MAFGFVFILVGAYMIVHPKEMLVLHPGPDKALLRKNQPEYVSRTGSRIYGGLAVMMGVGISWLASYRRCR